MLSVLPPFFALFASAALAASIPRSDLLVFTPAELVVCQPALLSWTGGIAPYFAEIVPGGEVGAAPLETFPTQDGDSYTWIVNLAAGTSLTVEVRDSTGAVAFSAPVTVQAGSSTSCLASRRSLEDTTGERERSY